MINVKEIIDEYLSLGHSKHDAVILAKSRLMGKSKNLSESNRKAELNRITSSYPKDATRSVVYGARKGIM